MNNNILLRLLTLFLAGLVAVSCEREADPMPEMPVDVTIDTRAVPATHTCYLHIFKNNSWLQTVQLTGASTTITLNGADLVSTNDFRFLYVSQPTAAAATSGVTVKKNGGGALAAGTTWADVRIEAVAKELSGDIFYKIDSYKGDVLASTTTIPATLIRLVGQMVVDIYRVDDAGGIDDPVATSGDVASVLDRVNQIKLTYTNLVQEIGFDNDGAIVKKTDWSTSLEKTTALTVGTGADLLKVTLPQDPVFAGTTGGSARIMGVWGLPADKQVRMLAKFSYYHTTPLNCTDPSPSTHTHTAACFPYKGGDSGVNQALFLNLPKASAIDGLSIKPNVYTVSKAGIRYDRVIDVGVSGGFGFITAWD